MVRENTVHMRVVQRINRSLGRRSDASILMKDPSDSSKVVIIVLRRIEHHVHRSHADPLARMVGPVPQGGRIHIGNPLDEIGALQTELLDQITQRLGSTFGQGHILIREVDPTEFGSTRDEILHTLLEPVL